VDKHNLPQHILALDLATQTGWAFGAANAPAALPQWGCFRLAGTADLNASFVALHNELTRLCDRLCPDLVIYETPLSQAARDRTRNTVDLLIGLAAIARFTATILDIPIYEQTVAEVRKRVLGKGSFRKPLRGVGRPNKQGVTTGDAKEEVRLWCEAWGWGSIEQADARDAAVLLRFAQATVCP
jgi:Holliday junction resolvasome RuvABC endonuclease subunit